jgi:hypothetical protein
VGLLPSENSRDLTLALMRAALSRGATPPKLRWHATGPVAEIINLL